MLRQYDRKQRVTFTGGGLESLNEVTFTILDEAAFRALLADGPDAVRQERD